MAVPSALDVDSKSSRLKGSSSVALWWCVLVVLLLFESVGGQNVHVSIQFNITEEQPVGFVVGQLPIRSGLRYRFSGDPPAQFHLDPDTGVITSRARIDREALTIRGGDGVGTVHVIVQSVPAPPAQLFDVRINVLDINDNPPSFPRPSVHMAFVETDPPGTRVILKTATDPDSGPNGTVSNYRIAAGDDDGLFRLSAASTKSGIARLLYLENVVELRTSGRWSHVLNITCSDGGSPSLHGHLLVNVDVTDVNDNAPIFDNEAYHAVVNETVAVDTVVLRVRATDADRGENAAVVYHIFAGDSRRQFAIGRQSGILTTARQPLVCPASCSPAGTDPDRPCRSKRCTLTVKATDSGRPVPLSAFASVHISLADVNDHAPVIWFRNQEPGRPLIVDESASEGDVVEAVSVTDADYGPNGETAARLISRDDDGAFAFIRSPIPELYFVLVAGGSRRLPSDRRYNLTIEARDSGSPPRVTHASLIILVGQVDVNPPVFELSSYVANVSERAPIGSFVASLTASSSSASPLTYHISSDGSDNLSSFFVISETGLVTTSAQLDWRQRSSFNLTVQASAGMLNAFTSLYVTVIPAYYTAPVFSRPTYLVVLSGSNATSDSLVTVVTATVEGRSDGVRYRLSDHVEDYYADTFQIGRTSGRIVTTRTLSAGMIYNVTVIAVNQANPAVLRSVVFVVVNVTKPPHLRPVIYPAYYFVKIVGNRRIGNAVATVRSLNESDSIIFSISGGVDSSKFSIDQSLGTVSIAAVLTPAAVYNITVDARDRLSGLSSRRPAFVRIFVMSSSSTAPPITFGQPLGYSFVVSEDDGRQVTAGVVGRSVGRVSASGGQSQLFYIVDGDLDGVFSVSTSTGAITTARHVDRERHSKFNLTVVAVTDADFAAIHVSVIVTDVNDNAPRFHGDNNVEVDVHVHSPIGFHVYAFRAADPDDGVGGTVRYRLMINTVLLSLDPVSGLMSLATSPTEETSFSLVVVAADSGVPSLSSTQTVRINVVPALDSNEPLFNTSTLWTVVSEATPINSRFFSMSSAAARLPSASFVVHYAVSRYHGIDDGRLRIFPDGWLYNARPLDREQTPEYVLTVTASEIGASRYRTWTVEVVVVVLDDNDNSPSFDNATYSFSVVEESSAADFAELVFAWDADAGRNSDLTYWIEGSTSGFSIDPLNGLLTAVQRFDREQLIADTGTDVVTLVVVAGDTGLVSRQSRVIVDVTVFDINDNAPTFDRSIYYVDIADNATVNSTVVMVNARDTDAGLNGTLFYRIVDDIDEFVVEETTGRVLLSQTLDVSRSTSYEFVVVASDRGSPSLTGTTTIRVRVVDTLPRPPRWVQIPQGSLEVGRDAAVGTLIGSVKALSQNPHSRSAITYSMIALAGAPFVVEASSGRLLVNGALNNELRRRYDITVVALDELSSLTASTTLRVKVLPDIPDRSLRFVDAANFRQRVEADAPTGTTVFRAMATDRDGGTGARMRYWLSRQVPDGQLFSVDADSGTVAVARALNSDGSATSYRLTLAVADDSVTSSYRLTSQQTFTIDVVDGSPEFLSPPAVVLPSGARTGTLVAVVVASAVGSHTVSYSLSERSNSGTNMFRIDAATGRMYLRTSLTDRRRSVYSVDVVATDSRRAPRSSSQRLSFIIVRSSTLPDTSLAFSSSTYSAQVVENSPALTPVVTVSASVASAPSNLIQYYITSISSPDGGGVPLPNYFDVQPTSGVVRTTRVLDRDGGFSTFVLEVYAVDTSPGLSEPRSRNVTVSLAEFFS